MNDRLDLNASASLGQFSQMQLTLEGVSASADRMSKSLSKAFASAIIGGKSFEQTLRTVALSLSQIAISSSLRQLLNFGMKFAMESFAGFGGGNGGGPVVAPFAEGGIVARPTFFSHGGGLGLMGERGAEAIMPLSRGPDGRLGIAARGATAAPVNVNVHIATPDAESFRRSQTQISGTLARAVMRGRRAL